MYNYDLSQKIISDRPEPIDQPELEPNRNYIYLLYLARNQNRKLTLMSGKYTNKQYSVL